MKPERAPLGERLLYGVFFLALALPMFAVLAGCPATRKAGLRRLGGERMRACLHTVPCTLQGRDACYRESEAWCTDAGLERRCADDFLFTSTDREACK